MCCVDYDYQVDFVSANVIDHYNIIELNKDELKICLKYYEPHLRFKKMFQREETSVTKVKTIVSCTGNPFVDTICKREHIC